MFTAKRMTLLILAASLGVSSAYARDTTLNLSFNDAVTKATEAGALDGSVKFYLAGNTPASAKIVQSEIVTNKKTNAFGKTDEAACDWALRSALIALEAAAKAQGANAVVDIVSFYKRNETKSNTTYECHAGGVVAGVTLKAKLAKI